MEKGICEIVSDEYHRIQAELRLTSQKNLVPGLQDELKNIRFRISDSQNQPTVSEIISPFQKIISHPRSTDVICCVAVSSLYNLLKVGLFTTQSSITELIECLCSCQYQITSEQDCSTLNEQIISTFLLICQNYSEFLEKSSAESIFRYCEQDLRQLTVNNSRAVVLSNCLSEISVLIVTKEDFASLVSETLQTLFSIADRSYPDSEWVSRIASIKTLIAISRSTDDICIQYREIIIYTCIILYQQLSSPDDRTNFILSLRLFYSVFSRVWTSMPLLFSNCFDLILNFCNSGTVSSLLKSTAFEILIDFISLPNFPLHFYSNFSTRPFLPNLFEKFLSIIISIANMPSAIPDSQSVAISLISKIIEQITPMANTENSRISIDSPTRGLFIDELDEYEKIINFTSRFNEDRSSLIKDFSYPEMAKLLFISPGISKDSLGEFFAKNDEVHKQILQNYINLFDFSDLTIDQSIRLFLSSFRIVGEGQIVDRLLDMFSIAFYESHKDSFFHDAASVHLFSVAWLMLHTSMHNKNVVKKDTLTDFLSLLKGQNNNDDYDTQFLTDIYNSVKRCKIEIEEDTKYNTAASWELLIQKQKLMKLTINESLPAADMTIRLFREIWQQAAPIYTVLFDYPNDSIELVLKTFSKCASIAAYYQMHDVLDNLVVHLCRFTHSNSKNGLSEEPSIKALTTLSSIIFDHGAQIQESWKYFIEMLLDMFRLDILPEEMRSQNNLSGPNETTIIQPMMWKNNSHRRSSNRLSFFRILTGHDNENDSDNSNNTSNSANDIRLMEQRSIVKDCKIHLIIDQSQYFSSQSLSYFLKSLILVSHSYLSSELGDKAPEAAVCFHWVTQTATVNEERLQSLWKPIYELFFNVLSDIQYERMKLLFIQRIITSLFTLINHTWGHKHFRDDIISLLDKVTSSDTRCVTALLPDLIAGIDSFFSLHIQTFAEFFHYLPVLSIFNVSFSSQNNNQLYLVVDYFPANENSRNSSIEIVQSTPVRLLHSLVTKFLECQVTELPKIDRLQDFYIPLLQTMALFCIKTKNKNMFVQFQDFQGILNFAGIEPKTPQMWDSVFEMVLFPSLARLTTEIPLQLKTTKPNGQTNEINQENENLKQRTLMMIRSIFKVFLSSYPLLIELPTFSRIWFKLIQFMLNLTKINDDDLIEFIPEMLGNALLVMEGSGVFEGNDERKQIWLNSVAVIEPIAPAFKTHFSRLEQETEKA